MDNVLHALEAWAALWLPALLRASWQGGLGLLLAWPASRWLTRISPTAACWLWRLAFIKLIAALLWATPLEIALAPRRLVQPAPETATAPQPPRTLPVSGQPAIPGSPLPSPAARTAPVLPNWPVLLLGFWGLGATAAALRLTEDWRRTRRLIRVAQPVEVPLLNAELTELCQRMGIRAAPRLVTVGGIGTPMLFGGPCPTIALPDAVCRESSPAELRLALAHELAHLQRRDLLWAWLPNLTRLLFFFHPLVWLAEREWRLTHEVACDAEAIRVTEARPAAYAAMLVKMVDPAPGAGQSGLITAAVAESYGSIQRRLLAMKYAERRSRKLNRTLGLAVALLGCAVIVPWRVVAEPTVSFGLERTLQIPEGALWPQAFSPDGRRLACSAVHPGSPSSIETYDTATASCDRRFRPVATGPSPSLILRMAH